MKILFYSIPYFRQYLLENKLLKLHNYQCYFSNRLGQGTDESTNYKPM